ncbi:uncharacterized protein PITG_01643 [Phytophthora infestans T30-4]|uniref:Uncharacterized protein n=1 Tax=Phytophthora infestans (strain T30-4) TaxID=403677 RepID=D0MTQ6_PHYIT|nr:uncharacterized protein PITG_01643 [Phytophthora infestans T30-4]EEY61353.1 conserved hypothetical protein [Phytophthora infestans T30-4]|eukprot:XP_002908270.1 conserved hypothetical protein [Phytophthora infestans T30-4]
MGGEDNDVMPVFQSRLRAKKEERMHQRQQEQVLPSNAHQQAVADSGEDTVKRRERSEARKRVIEYHGSIWDAVSSDNLDMVRNYFLVEGATMVLRRRHPDADQGGRTLLHCASWHGYGAIVEFILTTGCDVDVVDSVCG